MGSFQTSQPLPPARHRRHEVCLRRAAQVAQGHGRPEGHQRDPGVGGSHPDHDDRVTPVSNLRLSSGSFQSLHRKIRGLLQPQASGSNHSRSR